MSSENEVTSYRGKVRVVFKIERATVDPTAEHVYIVGSVSELGDWDVTCAKPTGYSGLNSWIVETFFEPHSIVNFKLCLMGKPSRDNLGSGDTTLPLMHREEGWFRHLCLTDVPLSVHVTYNHPDIVATALHSRLTVDGSPWCLLQGHAGNKKNQITAASEIKTVTAVKVSTTPCFLAQVVTGKDPLDEILVDTRSLRSRAHFEPALIESGTRLDKHVSVTCELEREKKKRLTKKKKRGSTLKKLLKRYGMEDINDIKDGQEKQPLGETCNKEMRKEDNGTPGKGIDEEYIDGKQLMMDNISNEIKKEENYETSEQTTSETGSTYWRHIIKIAAPVGLGVAATALYFWFKQK